MSSLIYSTTSLTIILSCLLLLSSPSSAFNITKLLSRYDGYGTFNSLLSQTKLAGEINHRKTITVLAVQDGSVGELAGKSLALAKRILMNHILLDYYDMQKLKHLKRKTALIITLYQTTGDAVGKQGHVNVTDVGNGQVRIGSGVRGSQLDVTLNKLVAAQPYNISVLDVSGLITTPGVEDISTAPAASPSEELPPTPAPGPRRRRHKSPPAYSPDMEDTDEDESTSDGPVADGPAPAPGKSGVGKGFEISLGLVATAVVTFLVAQ